MTISFRAAWTRWARRGLCRRPFHDLRRRSEDDRVRLTRTLDDGSTVERSVGFKPGEPGAIVCTSILTHRGAEPRLYRSAHAGVQCLHKKRGRQILTAFAKGDMWVPFNRAWKEGTGPGNDILIGSRGGGFAYFNQEVKSGLEVTYDPAQVKYPRLRWYPQYEQVNLELFSQDVELKTGETLGLDYTLRYLATAPETR